MRLPSEILLWNEYNNISSEIKIDELINYLIDRTKLQVSLSSLPVSIQIAESFAKAKVYNLMEEVKYRKPLLGEIEYEKRRLLDKSSSFGILYDGFMLQNVYKLLLPKKVSNLSYLNIILTNRLIGTYDGGRYHARVSIYGFPCIISTTGVVEAPAKPKEFYLRKQLGEDIIKLRQVFKDKFIDYQDERLTEVIKGYLMQALFFYILGEPFCEDKHCRLYNAHYQEDLIISQLNSNYEFCKKHTKILCFIKR